MICKKKKEKKIKYSVQQLENKNLDKKGRKEKKKKRCCWAR